jgi:iron complex outermembrane receptor protein
MPFTPSRLSLAVLLAFSGAALAQEATTLDSVVVTAPRMEEPLKVVTDPKAPRQPLPAHDGADFLKAIPGFSVIRKGGTDGDPVLRGFSGSRLGILLDGQEIYGGCGGRMDPPTAYVYPDSYDRVTVLKGPQSVLYGAGQSAGVVLFEKDIKRFREPGVKGSGSLTVGSFGRNDQAADVRAGNGQYYVQAGATRADANDYKDGNGKTIHSRYTRWSTNAAIGFTPDDNTRLELSLARSDGEAAYADRTMDGAKFARENIALKFEKRKLSALVDKVEALAYYNYVDHVMDNYSLRTKPAGASYMVSNPDRKTTGARASVTLNAGEMTKVTLGMDTKEDTHRFRSGMSMMSGGLAEASTWNKAWAEDMVFQQRGLFGEATHHLNQDNRVIGGLRVDWHEVQDKRATSTTRNATDKETLSSGFLRYESDFIPGAGTWYAGLGHSERTADFWERGKGNPLAPASSGFLSSAPEKTTQLDVGANYRQGPWSSGLSGFYSKVKDYLLVRWDNGGNPAVTRNVDATVYGGEADLAYQFTQTWKGYGALAYVHGTNDTDGKPLAQQPPLELRMGVNYDNRTWSFGALARMVASQDRYDVGSGNIVTNGKDLGRTGGFTVFSVNAGYRPSKSTLLTAGIDNLFDKAYAEHLSKSGATIPGYLAFSPNTRINEPGRTLWLKAQIALD